MKPPRFFKNLRGLMSVIALIAILIAVYCWVFRAELLVVEPAAPPRQASTDYDLFDIVLLELIENSDFFGEGALSRGAGKSQIVFGDTTLPGPSEFRWPLKYWMTERNVPLDLAEELLRRNPSKKRFVLPNYQPSSPNILVRDLTRVDEDIGFLTQFPDARGYVKAFLPAYSPDGRSALVVFFFGPTPHGAAGLYFLRKTNGRWRIVERRIGYFT